MRNTRRIRRMSRNRKPFAKMNLTSLMDVFTILVFFLLVNSATTEVLESPKQVKLPDSVIETKPRETVVIFISPDQVTVQGQAVANTAEILTQDGQDVPPVGDRLTALTESIIGFKTQLVAESQEVTILADKSVPFTVVKKIMSTCTSRGYTRISLAVMQKAPKAIET